MFRGTKILKCNINVVVNNFKDDYDKENKTKCCLVTFPVAINQRAIKSKPGSKFERPHSVSGRSQRSLVIANVSTICIFKNVTINQVSQTWQ